MALFGKRTARQKEIRRSKAERHMAWYQRLLAQLRLRPLTLLLLCGALAALLVNAGQDVLGLRVGQRIPRDLTARVRFRIADERATDRLRAQARDNAEVYYELDVSLLQDIRGRLTSALRIAREQAADPASLREKAAQIKVIFDDEGLAEIVRLATSPDSLEVTAYQQAVERGLRSLREQPLVEAAELAHRRTGTSAVLLDPEQSTERVVPSGELLYANNVEHVAQVVRSAAARAGFPAPLADTVQTSLSQMLRDEAAGRFRPLYRYNTGRSAKAAQDAENSVEPQYDVFAPGTRLAEAGALTEPALELLREEHRRFLDPDPKMQDERTLAALGQSRYLADWAEWARGILALVIVFGLGGYVLLVHEDLLGRPRRRVATALTLLAVIGAARLGYLHTSAVHLSVGAFAFAIALLAITSGRGPAYAAGGVLALMVTLAARQDLEFLASLVLVSLVLLLGLRDLRNRGRIITVGGLATLVALITTLLAGLLDGQTHSFVFWTRAIWAGLTTLAAAFIIEGILPTIERLFGVTTNMTLLEWCDPNKPLLRMLAAESPGTYNHSLLVGTLAGAAADAIGANGLLARTGAYYHDIGKINKPEYFVENQAMGVGNRHERLSPAMSHLIIIGHVKDGIEMAKEYGLPGSLHCFIPEHHGTGVVEYFYHAASRARKPGDPEVSDQQFRYPGPKPQLRETAIVMLCDAVEGAVRAMPEPTPNRIEDTVSRLIEKRMMDGQFDECDLTFRELEIIRSSLVKSLSSIYHGRISYPGAEEKKTTAESRTAS